MAGRNGTGFALFLATMLLLPIAGATEENSDDVVELSLAESFLMSDDELVFTLNYSAFPSVSDVDSITLTITALAEQLGENLHNETWTAPNSSHLNQSVPVTSFWGGAREHTLTLTLTDGDGVSLATVSEHFLVFEKGETLNPRRLVVFGDSLSDQGNVAAFTEYIPSPPYWSGRITNGPVWVEWTGAEFDITMERGVGALNGTNRAWGGAAAGEGMYQGVVMNAGPQITDYLANHDVSDDDVFAIWIGGNNFLRGAPVTQTVVDMIIGHIETLDEAGAKHIVVSNLPNMDSAPYYNSLTGEEIEEVRQRSSLYNSQLEHDVIAANARLDAVIQFINISEIFQDVSDNPEFYHITEIPNALCEFEGEMCINSPDEIPESDGHLFFDSVHPTALTHEILGKAVYEIIAGDDFDGDGVTLTDDLCLNTRRGESVDERGCSEGELDDDLDGVLNRQDLCPETPNSSDTVNVSGCAPEEYEDGESFNCENGETIEPELVDDGNQDCSDGSDERAIATVQSSPLPSLSFLGGVAILFTSAILRRRVSE